MRTPDHSEEDGPLVHAVRFTEAVQEEIDQEYARLTGISGVAVAADWDHRLLESVRSLATYPERCVVATEDQHFQRVRPGPPLRVLVYRRIRSGPAWRILFTVHESDENDPPTVRMRHIWHGARSPINFWPSENE